MQKEDPIKRRATSCPAAGPAERKSLNRTTASGVFFRDQAGATALEFAFIAIPLFALLYASVMTSIIYFTQDSLDAISDQMSRQILTGQAPASGNASEFKAQACASLPSYMSCSSLYINVQTVSSFSDVNAAETQPVFGSGGQLTNSLNYDPGSPGDIVVLELIYMLPVPLSGGLGGFNPVTKGAGQNLAMVSTVVIKAEPAT